jgi:hypothetical protein
MTTTFKLPTDETFKVQLKAMFTTRGDFSGITWQDMEMAIGRNADKYRLLWERLSNSDKKGAFAALSPCWTGIPFWGVSWAVARRMYPSAIMLFIVMIVLNIVFPRESDTARLLGMAIFASFAYKSAYLKWLTHCIRRINEQGLTGPEREAALRQIGGLDQKSGWIAAGALIVMGIVLNFVQW